MLSLLFPDLYLDSVFSINYRDLYAAGYRGIIFDIDGTLVPHGADATEAIEALFREIQAIGFQTLLLSNNGVERIERFLKNIDSMYIANGDKPKTAGYTRAIEALALPKNEVVFIGDQLFTDILGANRSGIDNILVYFIPQPGETALGKRRTLEKMLLRLYCRLPRHKSRLENICTTGGTIHAVEKG